MPANSQLRQWNPGDNQPKSIKYGIIKNKPCAELYFPRKSKKIILFLWLPLPNRKKQAIARMQVHTADWEIYWQFSHVPEGLYKKTKHRSYFTRSYFTIREYENEPNVRIITAEDLVAQDLEGLVDRALNTWREKL